VTTASTSAGTLLDTRPLHDLAHAAVRAQREGEGWWSDPLETAIVAAADAQHAPSSRRMAEPALEHLKQWLDSGASRALGDDAAAAALAAHAARVLRGGDGKLTNSAVELVGRTFQGNPRATAPLHVALTAWALSDLIPDRRDPPWDDVRGALSTFSAVGVNRALVLFSCAVADQAAPYMDPSIADASPVDRLEECVLLWLLDAATEVDIEREVDADRLRPLLTRRTTLLDRLSAELTPLHLTPREFEDFNPFDDPEEADEDAVGLFEAALLDLTLSRERPDRPLVTLEEAERLGAENARSRRHTYASLAIATTLVITAMAVAICILAAAPSRLTIGVGLALAAAGLAATVWTFLRETDTRWPSETLIVGLLLEAMLGVFLIVEGALEKVIVKDEVAALLGLGGLGLPFILQAIVARTRRK
jgi:hypothetical protein